MSFWCNLFNKQLAAGINSYALGNKYFHIYTPQTNHPTFQETVGTGAFKYCYYSYLKGAPLAPPYK